MKKIVVLFSLLIAACANMKLDEATAKSKVSEVLELLKNHQFEKAQELYTSTFQESEPLEPRIQKMQDIENVAGSILNYEFIESHAKEVDNENMLLLKYKIKCSKVELTEIFSVIIEDGKYKILTQAVTNK